MSSCNSVQFVTGVQSIRAESFVHNRFGAWFSEDQSLSASPCPVYTMLSCVLEACPVGGALPTLRAVIKCRIATISTVSCRHGAQFCSCRVDTTQSPTCIESTQRTFLTVSSRSVCGRSCSVDTVSSRLVLCRPPPLPAIHVHPWSVYKGGWETQCAVLSVEYCVE